MQVFKNVKSKVNTDIAVRNRNYHTATGNHMPVLPATRQRWLSRLNLPIAEAGTRFSDPAGKLSWPRWWLHPKIVYPLNTVTYLTNNQAVSWPGLVSATRRSQVQRPNHYAAEPPKLLPVGTQVLEVVIFKCLHYGTLYSTLNNVIYTVTVHISDLFTNKPVFWGPPLTKIKTLWLVQHQYVISWTFRSANFKLHDFRASGYHEYELNRKIWYQKIHIQRL